MSARARKKKPEPADLLGQLGPEWFDAVCTRHSRRRYDPVPLEAKTLSQMRSVCESFRPYADARVELWEDGASADLFRGIVGSYGKVEGAPHVLAIITSEGETAKAHAGYTGQAAVLEAARLGLGTCWVGGFFKHSAAAEKAGLSDGERVVAISPVGYANGPYSVSERLMRGTARSHSRKSTESIAPGVDDDWPCWARAAIECARLAPSATNRQPWRFRMNGGHLVVARNSGMELPSVTKELDCGIAMLHAELGAQAAGTRGTWTYSDNGLDVASFDPTG